MRESLEEKSRPYLTKLASIVFVCVVQIEARSVEHYKKLNIGMENKIIHLQQRLDEQVFEKTNANSVHGENVLFWD